MGEVNIGPAKQKVWNSPRSPHGSTPGGSVTSSSSSKSLPAHASGRPGIDAGDYRSKTTGDHGARQRRGVTACLPEGEQGLDAGPTQPVFAIRPDVGEEEIAERDVRHALRSRTHQPRLHARLVLGVGARPR